MRCLRCGGGETTAATSRPSHSSASPLPISDPPAPPGPGRWRGAVGRPRQDRLSPRVDHRQDRLTT
eukprot:15093055-Alexandrium_andersonii.AAC.1